MTQNDINNSLGQLVPKLQKEDSNYARLSKGIQFMYWFFIPVYVVVTWLEYSETEDIRFLFSGVFFIISFVIFALSFRKYYKIYNHVDYSLPTIQMLKNAAYRYQPFQKNMTIWLLLALVFMDVGLTLSWMEDGSVIRSQIIFLGSMMFGAVIGLIIWYYKYKPLRDTALKLIKELESE